MFTRSIRAVAALLLAAGLLGGWRMQADAQSRPAAPPSAPSGLTSLVNGSNVSLFWTHATGAFTHYVIEAGGSPGTTFFSFPTSSLRDGPPDAAVFPQLLAAFGTQGVAGGNYYVRVRGVNGAEVGAATPDLLVPVTGGCRAPGTPTDLYAVTRGTTAYIQWSAGSGGLPSNFVLSASNVPGGAPIVTFPLGTNYLNIGGIPAGTYYVRVAATNACGVSAPSAEITVTAPSTSAARSADPVAGGRLTAQYVRDIVAQFYQQNPGLLAASCPNPNSKYNLNPFLNALVDRLRLIDQRWGYNSKPTRGPAQNGGAPVVVAGDEIAFHFGADAPEGSPNVALIDVISGHCGPNPVFDYRVFTNGEFGRWTGAGRF